MYLSPRMASCLLWLGRYQQRIETLGKETLLQFDTIIDRDLVAGKKLFQQLGTDIDYQCATDFLQQACYGQHPSSLLNLSSMARENAIIIRDLLSDTLFGSVNSVYHELLKQQNNATLDAYQLSKLLMELEYFWGRLSTRLVKDRAVMLILFGQTLEIIDLKMRLYGEIDTILKDAHQLNWLGKQLSDQWLNFDPLNHNLAHNMAFLQTVTSRVIVDDV